MPSGFGLPKAASGCGIARSRASASARTPPRRLPGNWPSAPRRSGGLRGPLRYLVVGVAALRVGGEVFEEPVREHGIPVLETSWLNFGCLRNALGVTGKIWVIYGTPWTYAIETNTMLRYMSLKLHWDYGAATIILIEVPTIPCYSILGPRPSTNHGL